MSNLMSTVEFFLRSFFPTSFSNSKDMTLRKKEQRVLCPQQISYTGRKCFFHLLVHSLSHTKNMWSAISISMLSKKGRGKEGSFVFISSVIYGGECISFECLSLLKKGLKEVKYHSHNLISDPALLVYLMQL